MKTAVLFLLIIQSNIFSQADWEKWGKADVDYISDYNSIRRDYGFHSENAGEFISKSFANAYWFFISDLDGDNCPFRPSCSSFLIDAVEETNIFQGTLMFFDRFTRDLNIFKKGKYPYVKPGYLYDPAALYTLSEEKIHYIPSQEIITSE